MLQAVLEEAEMISSQYSRTVVDSRDGLLSTIDKITGELLVIYSNI